MMRQGAGTGSVTPVLQNRVEIAAFQSLDSKLRAEPPPNPHEGLATLITTSLHEAGLAPLHRAPAPAEPAATARNGAAPHAELLPLAISILDDAKAEDVLTIDLAGKTSIADHMIIASGRSDRHVGAIAEQIMSGWKDAGHGTVRVEGMPSCEWVLIDAGDIIIHVFKPEVRQFYNLEKMWGGDRPRERLDG
jgi:ribosome-associated protein